MRGSRGGGRVRTSEEGDREAPGLGRKQLVACTWPAAPASSSQGAEAPGPGGQTVDPEACSGLVRPTGGTRWTDSREDAGCCLRKTAGRPLADRGRRPPQWGQALAARPRPGTARPLPASLRNGRVFGPCPTRSPPAAFGLLPAGRPPGGRTARCRNLFRPGAVEPIMSLASPVRRAGSERLLRGTPAVLAGPPRRPLGPGSMKPRGRTPQLGGGEGGRGHPTRVSERQPTDRTAQ